LTRHLRNYDWVFWTDADSLIMDAGRRLESIISRARGKDMIVTWETGAAKVNTGQWLVRNSDWSAQTLAAIADPACPNGRPDWFEQGAFIDWLDAEPRRWSHVAILHPRVMNSTPAAGVYQGVELDCCRFREGDFIIHFWPLGRQADAILEMMQAYEPLSRRAPNPLRRALARLSHRPRR
jgi:hypothetical protein